MDDAYLRVSGIKEEGRVIELEALEDACHAGGCVATDRVTQQLHCLQPLQPTQHLHRSATTKT